MIASRRLLVRGGAVILPPPASGTFELAAANDGGFEWFCTPSAVTYGGGSDNAYTAFGYIDGSGNVECRVVTNATQAVTAPISLHASWQIDDHDPPVFVVRPSDRKLVVLYMKHASTSIRRRVSVSSVDDDPLLADGFDAELGLNAQVAATAYTYPSMFLHSGRIWLFFRSSSRATGQWSYTYSDDGGDTWATRVRFYQVPTAYVRVQHDGAGTFHFAVTSSEPNVSTTALGHFSWDRTDWKTSDGTTITSGLPLDFADATPVYADNNAWVWDILVDGSGHPIITFPSYEGAQHHARQARWSGSAWSQHLIADCGDGIKTSGYTGITGGYYPAGMTMVPEDPDKVYVSRQTGSGIWELYLYETSDSGATWSGTAITSGSTNKNLRPVVPVNRHANLGVLFMRGTYADYGSWNCGTWGAAA